MVSQSPIVTAMTVIPVAGRDSMLLNLSGAHGPFFTRNVVILTDSSGATGIGEVSIERPSEQGRGGTDQRPVDHLEVVVQDRERGVSARGKGSKSEARDGPRSLAGWLASVTGVLRAHGLPPGGR